MQRMRRGGFPTGLAAAFLASCAMAAPLAAQAGTYPDHAVEIIIPATAGTTGDLIARTLVPKLSKRWGVPVVVDNKVGAGGAIGIADVAKSAPDGYTFLMSTTAFSTLAALRSNLPYDPDKGFTPVVLVGKSPLVLVTTNEIPAKTVPEFLDYVKKQPPGRLNYASPGVGSVHHLTMELFQQETGVSLTHVPYKGTSGVLNDVAAGQVQASFVVLQTAAPLVKAGKMRILAVVSEKRSSTFPDIPTLAELGMKRMAIDTWVGLEAPAGTPDAVVQKVNADINSLLKDPEVQASLDKMGVTAAGGKPEVLGDFVRNEIKTWTGVVTQAKITAD
jgi:tripartite-type tricarboxylate transporter receptor subunit TctC